MILKLRITHTGRLLLNASHDCMLIWVLTLITLTLASMNKSTEHIGAVSSIAILGLAAFSFLLLFEDLLWLEFMLLMLSSMSIFMFWMLHAVDALVELLVIWVLTTHWFIFIVLDRFTFVGEQALSIFKVLMIVVVVVKHLTMRLLRDRIAWDSIFDITQIQTSLFRCSGIFFVSLWIFVESFV